MKKHNRWSTFLSGMLTGALLVGGGTAALAAAGGSVSFGSMGLTVNGKTSITAGETLTNAAGCEIPSTIVYTDEKGGGTTYIPVRQFSEMLNIPVDWAEGMIYLGDKPGGSVTITGTGDSADPIWTEQPLHQAGAQVGDFTEVEPILPANDKILKYSIWDEAMTENGGTLSSAAYDVFPDEGGYCSISVTNQTTAPLRMRVFSNSTITLDYFPDTIVPAGETVTRTFRAGAYTGGLHHPKLSFDLSRDFSQPNARDSVNVKVTVVSFDPERTGPALFGTFSIDQGETEIPPEMQKALDYLAQTGKGDERGPMWWETQSGKEVIAEAIKNNGYARNSKGETYGSSALSELLGFEPDLSAAVGTEGQHGYIREEDSLWGQFNSKTPIKSPEDAMRYMEWLKTQPDEYMVPLYDSEGNVIGEFRMSQGETTVTPGVQKTLDRLAQTGK